MAAKKKRRQPRKITPRFKPWRRVGFTDLHVSAATIVRAVALLARVRATCVDRGISTATCFGDFWDQRGVLSVRQMHHLQDEFERWREDGLELELIPGNHDQVSIDGTIHGVRIFDAFPHIHVMTEPTVDEELGLVWIPWREDSDQQAEMFKQAPAGFTAFAHCEIKDAMNNSKYKVEGKVMPANMEHLRAVYAGHFHKRQKLGNAWYLGSPFEMNFGERDWPHGICVLSSDALDPEWIDLDEFAKHYRFTYPDDLDDFEIPRAHDIVEVLAPAHLLGSPKFLEDLDTIEASDVRPLPIAEDEAKGSAPTAALSLDEAIERYVYEVTDEDEEMEDADREALVALGRKILSEVPDTAAIVPLGKVVEPMHLVVRDFCGIQGTAELDLADRGSVLLKGSMGVGKTSLFDAMTWCLYGVTTPRKPGSSGSQLRADDVINDDADDCEVSILVSVDGKKINIHRSKKRGKGAKVKISASKVKMPTGISDSQDQINHIMGMDYDLWRTCVSLGQGAVGNFVTDADKRRKELLSRAFQLGACPHAVKLVRKQLKEMQGKFEPLRIAVASDEARIETMKSTDFSAESKRWEEQRASGMKQQEDAIAQLQEQVAGFDKHLATEPQWVSAKEQCEKVISDLGAKLTKSSGKVQAGKLHQKMGALNAERAQVEAEIGALKARYTKIQATSRSGVAVCDACGQALDHAHTESVLADLESQIGSATASLRDFDTRKLNLETEMGKLLAEGDKASAGLQAQLDDARKRLKKCNEGLSALARVKANREHAVASWNRALADIEKMKKSKNPFAEKMKEQAEQLEGLQKRLDGAREAMRDLEAEMGALRFWEAGFGPKGVPVLVLRLALHELESQANRFLGRLMGGRVFVQLEMAGENLGLNFHEMDPVKGPRPRSYLQLSGGQRRCAELAFVPFALSEVIFSRTGVRVPMLLIDELTTHLDPDTKPMICKILMELGRSSVFVIDHDQAVQGEFDQVIEVTRDAGGVVALEEV